MFAQDLFRSGRWHRAIDEFSIINGPSVGSIGDTSALVSWEMSEACSGQVEYGTTSGSYTDTTTEEPITGGYAAHAQSLTGLTTDTTYYGRTKSVSAASVTVYSGEFTFDTTGVSVPAAGPRYDFYGAGAGGNWPALPGTYTLVPQSVLDDPDQASALETWLNDTALVPNGTTVVFDRTELGVGTTYTFDTSVQLNHGTSVARNGITLWMYNCKFIHTTASPPGGNIDAPHFYFRLGGWTNLTIQGGEFEGPNTAAGTNACRTIGGEFGHALCFQPNFDGVIIQDCWMHALTGEGVYVYNSDSANAYSGQTYPADMEISYNLISGTGRQGVAVQQGDDYDIKYNIIEDVALWPFDSEDTVAGTDRVLTNVSITYNIFRRWNWHIQSATDWYRSLPIAFVQRTGEIDTVSDITISDNTFQQGARGYGDPEAEAAYGLASGDLSNGLDPVIVIGAPWGTGFPAINNITITDNTFDLDPDQQGTAASPAGQRGEAIIVRNGHTVTITGNSIHDKCIWLDACTGVTQNTNGSGTVYET